MIETASLARPDAHANLTGLPHGARVGGRYPYTTMRGWVGGHRGEFVHRVATGEVLRERHPDPERRRPAHGVAPVDPEVAERGGTVRPRRHMDRALDLSAAHEQEHLLRDV